MPPLSALSIASASVVLGPPALPLYVYVPGSLFARSDSYECPKLSVEIGGGVPPRTLYAVELDSERRNTSAPVEDSYMELATATWATRVEVPATNWTAGTRYYFFEMDAVNSTVRSGVATVQRADESQCECVHASWTITVLQLIIEPTICDSRKIPSFLENLVYSVALILELFFDGVLLVVGLAFVLAMIIMALSSCYDCCFFARPRPTPSFHPSPRSLPRPDTIAPRPAATLSQPSTTITPNFTGSDIKTPLEHGSSAYQAAPKMDSSTTLLDSADSDDGLEDRFEVDGAQ